MRRNELQLPPPPKNDRPGDRWMCGRGSGQEPCVRGPSDRGVCPMQKACRVKRSWFGRRRRALLIATITLIAVLLFMIKSRHQMAIIKPGDLSNPHAQILAATLTPQRCAACHPQASDGNASWFNPSISGHQNLTQTDACLVCHHKTIRKKVAKLAHNLDAQQLARLTLSRQRLAHLPDQPETWRDLLPGPAVDMNNIECATCHREHRGSTADLLAISDTQCQTCHSDRFGDFATSHPNWQQWPYGRGGEISFNHATHANKYYPAEIQNGKSTPFDCSQCHERTGNNEISRTASYRDACASCHDEALRLQIAEGLELLALPILPSDSAAKVQPWPETATGFYDGTVSPLAELLLQADPEVSAALQEIPNLNFADVKTAASASAAETLANEYRQLINEIANQGQPAMIKRSKNLGLTPESVQQLLRTLSPQVVEEAQRRWFVDPPATNLNPSANSTRTPDTKAEKSKLSGPDELLGEPSNSNDPLSDPNDPLSDPNDLLSDPNDLLGPDPMPDDSLLIPGHNSDADPLALDPLALDPPDAEPQLATDPLTATDSSLTNRPRSKPAFDAESMLPAGGWFRDDQRLSIRYRGSDHDDPVLKAMVDIIRQLPEGMPTRDRLLKNRAVAACISCHPSAAQAGGRWRSQPQLNTRQFTKFSHASHLNVAELSSCIRCHQVAGKSASTSPLIDLAATSASHEHIEFLPLTREVCSSCHRSGGSGDNCTTCHRYHIDLRSPGTISIAP